MGRISREEYWLSILEAVRLRSSCDRGKAGAIIVRDKRLLTTGYVGAPIGLPHCDEGGHELEYRLESKKFPPPAALLKRASEHCIRTVHAELNAILQAAKFGISIEGAEMYCTMFPCYDCAKAIINVGIKRVVATFDYKNSGKSQAILFAAGVRFKLINEETLTYAEHMGGT